MNAVNFTGYLFGASMAVHTLFANTLPGLAMGLVLVQILFLFSKNENIKALIILLTRIFAVQFSIAIISGLTLEVDLRQNWTAVGSLLIPLINHPMGRTAFLGFLIISSSLVILICTNEKIHSILRLLLYVLIFISTILLSWWALVVNSWMHTPSGTTFIHTPSGELLITITNLKAFIFNPSFIPRFLHLYVAIIIEGLLMQGLMILFILRRVKKKYTGALSTTLVSAIILLLAQPILGHLQLNILIKSEPTNIAATEGYYDSQGPMHHYLIGITNPQTSSTIGIHLSAFFESKMCPETGKVEGLNQINRSEWPRVKASFYSFHFMILSWPFILLLPCIVLFKSLKGLNIPVTAIYLLLAALLLSVLALLAGWIASESGRQPWLIYNILKTSSANSFHKEADGAWLSIITNLIMPIGLCWCWVKLQKIEIERFIHELN